jgi:mannose-6-phosphate isomerase-like protein (cupin superfamily)
MKLSMNKPYDIHLDTKFNPLELIDVPDLVTACKEKWFNQTLCQVNDCVVRLGILHGEFHWHKHDEEDEFFFVLDGELLVDLENEAITLKMHQGYLVPKGVVHRTRAPQKTVVLMIERSTVQPTGD